MTNADKSLFPGFSASTGPVGDPGEDVSIHCEHGGKGPPLLLLHGYPQTHAIWHKVAPRLAERYTVVCADLRGYGDSGKPRGTADHANYSKRVMARDMVEADAALGTSVRGRRATTAADASRTAWRAITATRSTRLCRARHLADARPCTSSTDHGVRERLLPLVLPDPAVAVPETLIGHDPKLYLRAQDQAGRPGHAPSTARGRRVRALLLDPAAIHGSCEDYRAAARSIWSTTAPMPRGQDPLPAAGAVGREGRGQPPVPSARGLARGRTDVRGKALPSGHFIAEEAPELLLAELLPFLAQGPA